MNCYNKVMAKVSEDEQNQKNVQLNIQTNDKTKLIPKLCNRVLLSKNGDNTVLTFLLASGDDGETGIIIERIIIDSNLQEKVIKLLQDDLSNRNEA